MLFPTKYARILSGKMCTSFGGDEDGIDGRNFLSECLDTIKTPLAKTGCKISREHFAGDWTPKLWSDCLNVFQCEMFLKTAFFYVPAPNVLLCRPESLLEKSGNVWLGGSCGRSPLDFGREMGYTFIERNPAAGAGDWRLSHGDQSVEL